MATEIESLCTSKPTNAVVADFIDPSSEYNRGPMPPVRKNCHIIWLFAGSETAGRRAAAIMGLLATAKAIGHEPHAWLTDVLTRLPTTLDRDIGHLLPHRRQPKG